MKVTKVIYNVKTGTSEIVEVEEIIDEPVVETKPTIEEQIVALQRALINQKIVGGGYHEYNGQF